MAEQKTKPTVQSVEAFLEKVTDEKVRDDCYSLIKIMKKATGANPSMWGPSIIGFGKYHYKYESGHEGDACLTGFSPRKTAISLYIMSGFTQYEGLLKKLGKHKAGKGCLYIKRLEDVDVSALETLIEKSIAYLKNRYQESKRE
jgi:hypothetical protein